MSSDDYYQRCLVKLNQYKGQTTWYRPDVAWLRSLAFSFGRRDANVVKMIDGLITDITPLAIAERLKN